MAPVDFLNRRGLLVIEDFLGYDFCASICGELKSAPQRPASLDQTGVSTVDTSVRRAAEASVSAATYSEVHERISSLRARLEQQFSISLVDCEPPAFIAYESGDFILPHTDVSNEADSSDALKARKVVVIVSLNDPDSELPDGGFCGGRLTLYGVVAEPPWNSMGFPVSSKAGRLIGFPADLVHEVTEITHGTRFVTVSRFR